MSTLCPAHAAEELRACSVHGRQRCAIFAGREVTRPDGLGCSDRIALGRPAGASASSPDPVAPRCISRLQLRRHALSEGEAVLAALKKKYPEIKTLADVTPAVGIANAYDAMNLTAIAIAKAGSTDGSKIREAFEQIDAYDGLIKNYKKPFSATEHDALTSNDYIFTHFKEGQILPLTN